MAGILEIKRGVSSVPSLNDGEFYLNKGINAVQIGSGSAILTLLPLNQIVSGDIILNGNIYANNLNISSSYALTSSYSYYALTASYIISSSTSQHANTADTASYVLSSNVYGPWGFNSIITSSYAVTASYAPAYLLTNVTQSMLAPYLLISNTGSMLNPYLLISQTSSFLTSADLSNYVTNSQTSSFVTNSQTSSFITNSQTSSFVTTSQTSSFIVSSQTGSMLAPYLPNSQTSSFVTNSQTSSFVTNSQTSSMTVATASYVSSSNVYGPNGYNSILTASYAQTASWAVGIIGGASTVSSSYPFDVTGSTIYSFNSKNFAGNTTNIPTEENIIIGESAGFDSTISSSIVLGYLTAIGISASRDVIAMGESAGQYSLRITGSTFIGHYAGQSSNASFSNFIGYNSGINAYNASNSNFVGYNSGRNAVSASYSTLIGYQTGYRTGSGVVGIGNNNIIIGTNITLDDRRADSINIGGIIFGTGSYSTTTGRPYSGSAAGRIGINVPVPAYNLHVSGTVAFPNLPQSSSAYIVMYDSGSGQLFYTASSAISGSGGGSGTPAPSDTYIQYNQTDSFGGDSSFRYIYESHSLQQGNNTLAIGDYSHVEGENSITYGIGSHAEGSGKTGISYAAYAESIINGVITLSGSYGNTVSTFPVNSKLLLYDAPFDDNYGKVMYIISQSYYNAVNTIIELYDTSVNTTSAYILRADSIGMVLTGEQIIPGDYSHAEGIDTKAVGDGSHAEGYDTRTFGFASHAEGYQTIALNNYSHAEGYYTKAAGDYSHAEGYYTTARGEASHTEGYGTFASGTYSHAEGGGAMAFGVGTHAEGINTLASGTYSHAEGADTKAIGDYSHAEGYSTRAASVGSHAEGLQTAAGAVSAFSASLYNFTTPGVDKYVEIDTNDNGDYSFYYTNYITIDDFGYLGYGVIDLPVSQSLWNGSKVIVWISEANTTNLNWPDSTPALAGNYIEALITEAPYYISHGNHSHAEGYTTLATGLHSHAEGENTIAAGPSSHTEGAYTYAYGEQSHAEGYGTTAYGAGSHTEGANTQAIGYYSHAEGYDTRAIGNFSHAEGLATSASGDYQHVIGKYNLPNTSSLYIIGNGSYGNRSNLALFNLESIILSKSIYLPDLTSSSDVNGVLMYNSSSGQVFYTASSAISSAGGGTISGSGENNYITLWSGSYALSSSIIIQSNGNLGIGKIHPIAKVDISGSTLITKENGTALTLVGSGSNNPVFSVYGSQGELFTITDSLSGSLFSVHDISGLPVIESFSDATTLIGNYEARALYTSVKKTIISGVGQVIYEIPTASYDGVFYDYTVVSGSNARSGQVIARHLSGSINFAEIATPDFGDTTGFELGVIITGSYMALTGSSTTSNWILKTIVRSI